MGSLLSPSAKRKGEGGATLSTFSVFSEDGTHASEDAAHAMPVKAEASTNQVGSPTHEAPAAPVSFVASVGLTPAQMDDFLHVEGHFVYLQPRGGLARTAYDLQVVDHTKVEGHAHDKTVRSATLTLDVIQPGQANPQDYYTLSREGITHFLANESDFTPLHIWEREFAQFNKIRKVRLPHQVLEGRGQE
jgi:hypothetical protein